MSDLELLLLKPSTASCCCRGETEADEGVGPLLLQGKADDDCGISELGRISRLPEKLQIFVFLPHDSTKEQSSQFAAYRLDYS